jgi:glycerol-3-phosphate acyltransferase PlsY
VDTPALAAILIPSAFLLGSIPFGLLIGRAKGVDIRQHGSKNIGATNVGRVLGRPLGFLCFGLDWLKGFAPALTAGWLLDGLNNLALAATSAWTWLAVAVAAIAGHMFSPWLRFRGGKGVATGFGALVGVWPALGIAAFVALVVWVALVKATRYVGLSSCVAAVSVPVSVAALWPIARSLGLARAADAPAYPLTPYLTVAAALAAVVVVKHRGNLARTWQGTELKVGTRR